MPIVITDSIRVGSGAPVEERATFTSQPSPSLDIPQGGLPAPNTFLGLLSYFQDEEKFYFVKSKSGTGLSGTVEWTELSTTFNINATSLGLLIGTDVQAYNANLDTLSSDLAPYTNLNLLSSTNTFSNTNTFSSTFKLSSLSDKSSEKTALVIDGSNIVGSRELGDLAFDSTNLSNFATKGGENTFTAKNNFQGGLTASNIDATSVDTDTLFINGLLFTEAEAISISGSTAFGTAASASSNIDPETELISPHFLTVQDVTHQFTGSVLITGSLVLGETNISSSLSTLNTNIASNTTTLSGISANTNTITTNSESAATSFLAISGNISTNTTAITTNSQSAANSFLASANSMSLATQSISNLVTQLSNLQGIETTANLTELSVNSLFVSPHNTASVIPIDKEKVEFKTDSGTYWGSGSSFIDKDNTITNLIDNASATEVAINLSSNNFNAIFDFGEDKAIVSEFRTTFSNVNNLPKNVFIYGKNTEFEAGADDGTLLGTGARPGQGGMNVSNWNFVSSNPLTVYGIGDGNNLRRTSSIAETSLTSSFRYYRLRFNDALTPANTSIPIVDIYPVIRSFSSNVTSISASNGVLNVNQIVTNNLIGTASFANEANLALSASHALTASHVAGVNFNDTLLTGNTVVSGSLIVTSSTEGAVGNLTVAGNFALGSITDVETTLNNVATLTNINQTLTPLNGATADDASTGTDIGTANKKFKNIFAVNTFFGGIHEINLETEGLSSMQEGTVLTVNMGVLGPCELEADPLIMGVVSKGSNYPIILGAEPVLVTGEVNIGDYIISSKIKGHGKAVKPEHIYDQKLFGKIIAQSLEKGNAKSHIIKAMIRKM